MQISTAAARTFTTSDKYLAVASYLKEMGAEGSILDIGARDRILASYLPTGRFKYHSADLEGQHDYRLDLERPLAFPDRAFDYSVCLDVLEHVEKCHFALGELLRVTGKAAFIALPNFSTLQRRWSFLKRGSLSTDKYALLPAHQGDRHRWLTTYREMGPFIEANARQAGFRVSQVIEEIVGGRAGRFAARKGYLRNGLFTERCTFVVTRDN